MSAGPNDPYARRGEEADRHQAARRAGEELHLRNLMESASGRWLLAQLVGDFERELQRRTSGHNSDDCYHRGIQDNARKYRDLLVRHFGHAALDALGYIPAHLRGLAGSARTDAHA